MPNRKKIISPANHMIWLGEQNSLDLYLLNQERAQQFTLQELQGPQAKVYAGDDEEEENPFGYMSQLIGDVGIVYVNGTLVTEYAWYNRYLNQVSYDEIRSASVDLVNKGARVLLNVYRTSGGAANGISAAAEFQKELESQGVESYSYGETMMLSGGYWLGASGKKVFTEKMNLSGSIGVVLVHISQKDLLDKLGITATVIRMGEFKALGTPYEKLTEAAREDIEGRMRGIYDLFLDHVGEFRKLSRQHLIDTAAEGRVFMGQQAVEAGLADGILTFDKVLKYISGQVSSKAQVPGSAISSPQYRTGEDDMKHRILTKAGTAAVASGVPEADALKDPQLSEEVEETPAAAAAPEPKTEAENQPAPAADPAPAAVVETPEAPKVDADMMGKLMDLSAKLALAEQKVSDLTNQISLAGADREGLRKIAVSAINRMQIPLGYAASDFAGVSDSALFGTWEKINTDFQNKFPGSARARTASDADQQPTSNANYAPVGNANLVGIGAKKQNR